MNAIEFVLSTHGRLDVAFNNAGGGAIVNTASVSGHIGLPQVSIYVATKHAVEGLTKAVALEFAKQGIRVNSVAPGASQELASAHAKYPDDTVPGGTL